MNYLHIIFIGTFLVLILPGDHSHVALGSAQEVEHKGGHKSLLGTGRNVRGGNEALVRNSNSMYDDFMIYGGGR